MEIKKKKRISSRGFEPSIGESPARRNTASQKIPFDYGGRIENIRKTRREVVLLTALKYRWPKLRARADK